MKRIGCLALVLVLSVALLCGCGHFYGNKVVGVWEGTGDMSKVGVMAPADAVKRLTFDRNEVLTVETALPDGETRVDQYRWYVTDDAMTFGRLDGNGGFGVSYRVSGNQLRIGDGDGEFNIFVRVD